MVDLGGWSTGFEEIFSSDAMSARYAFARSNTYQRVTHLAGKLRTLVYGAVW